MSTSINRSQRLLTEIFRPGLRALRLYWVPFFLIQLVGALIVFFYYHSSDFQIFCDRIAAWKTQGGLWAATWLAGLCWGLLPEALKAATGRGRPLNKETLGELVFLFFFFGVNGILVQVFYSYQVRFFGESGDWITVVSKLLMDQFVFTPFIVYPYTVVLFTWKEKGYRALPALRALSLRLYWSRVKPLLFIGWLYWFPMVSCIYAMPTSIQVPLNICISAAWVMLVVFILEACENPESRPEEESLPLRQGGD